VTERLRDRFAASGSLEKFLDDAFASELSDGFPFALAEPALIDAALATTALGEADVVGAAHRPVAVADAAAAVVLAGGRPEYLPAVLAAASAFFETVGSGQVDPDVLPDTAQCVIVSGPQRARLGVHAGIGAFGPGWRANASIGRALRLLVRWAYEPPLGAFGDPTQYSFCFGEEDSPSPWVPLRVEQGLAADDSAVTVHTLVKATKNFDRNNTDVACHLDDLALFLRDQAGATGWFPDRPTPIVLVVGTEWHRQFVAAGWSKADIREYLVPRLVADADATGTPVRLAGPDDFTIVRAGGPGEATEWCLIGVGARPVTKNLDQFGKG
jgi:hypothetical protein